MEKTCGKHVKFLFWGKCSFNYFVSSGTKAWSETATHCQIPFHMSSDIRWMKRMEDVCVSSSMGMKHKSHWILSGNGVESK
jgi:hypothetical protein